MAKKKTLKGSANISKLVLFTQSPTGKFNLGYSANDTGEVESKLADELIESDYAIEVKDEDVKPE